MHNRREYEKYGFEMPNNIDPTRTHLNVTLVDKDIRKAYKEIFGDSVERYNSRQSREDRKIEDYYEKIAKSKNGKIDVIKEARKREAPFRDQTLATCLVKLMPHAG